MLSRGEIFAEDDGERRVRPGLPATEIMDTIERAAGRITTLREFMMPAIQAVYPIPGIARIRLLFFGSVSAIPPSCSSCSRQCSFRCYSMLRPVHD
jgi:hypothetical protein